MLTLYFVKSASAVERGVSFTSFGSSGFVASDMMKYISYVRERCVLRMKEG